MKKIKFYSLMAVIFLIALSSLLLRAESINDELIVSNNKIMLNKAKKNIIINDDGDEKCNIKFSISKKKILYAKKKGEGIFDIYVHNAKNGCLEFTVNSGVRCLDLLDVEIPNNNILFCRCDKDKGFEEVRFFWLKDKSNFFDLLGAKFSMPRSADKIIYVQLPPRGAPEFIKAAIKLLSLTGNKKIKFDQNLIPEVYLFENEDIGMLSDFVWKDPNTVAFIVAGIENNKLVVLNFNKVLKNPGKTVKIFDKSVMKIEKLEWVNNGIRITGTNHNGEAVMAVIEI